MRIVVDYRPALRARTGVGEYLFHIVRAMAEAARGPSDPAGSRAGPPEITIFSSSWKDRPRPVDLARLPGVHLVDRRLPVQVLNLLWHRLEWPPIEMLTAAGARFDIAYSLHPLLLPSRATQVVTIHDLDFLAHPERASGEVRRDYPVLVRKHARRAAHVVVNSHYTARQVEHELDVPPDRITVCYPGAPDWADGPRAADRSARHVLFLGTLEERKNIGTLLAAYGDVVARHPGAPPLVMAGAARPEAAAWLAQIGRPPLAGHVQYLGYVTEARRRELFESAALLVLPSRHEGFGIPVLEAMSMAVPVVVSNRGALPEVAGDAGVVVDPDDRDGLASALERMLTDDAFAAASAARGLARARRFRWEETAACVLRAFERALTSPS